MSNRLEQEFPRTSWQATAPIGRGGVAHEVVWHYVEHGRQLRNRALRDGVRAAVTAVVRAPMQVVAFVRCMARSPARRLPGRDCWRSPAHGA